jgi:hypothetical protein
MRKPSLGKAPPVFIRRRFGILFFHEPGNPRDTWSVADPWVLEDTGEKEEQYLIKRLASDYSSILVEPSRSMESVVRKFRAIRKASFACNGMDTEKGGAK